MAIEEPRSPIVLPGLRPSRRQVPTTISDRYQEIELIGEGGMGTVYRALDPRLGRKVAIKLMKGDDPHQIERLISEARAQASITHEHICKVYEAGLAEDEPYIVMQLIEGEPLSKVRERLSLEQCVKIMKEVALAVHEAHRLGIIHRDLKPGNILVEEREDGTKKPYVVDFGLARQVEAEGQTQTGAVLGTPAYMSPEQARGDVRSLDRRSDVYSLGATLYDIIAGRPPFVAEHPWKLLLMIESEDSPTLGRVKKGVSTDLETIVMKCLEREPKRRYDSARALAEDLQRYLDGEPIGAKRASLAYVILKKIKKNKLLSAVLLALVVVSLVLAVTWVQSEQRAAKRERLAQELGEGVKEIELFLRAAYALPVHDVERERDVVRQRLDKIESMMAEWGPAGEGPAHYAIGRGHLALGDPEKARLHLDKALKAGYATAELKNALGRALGELYRRQVAETKRITNEAERKKKIAALEKELRDPALDYLREAVGARSDSPLYSEGLVALYEGKNEEAIAKARQAYEKTPWLYEPKKLEADALFAEGSKYRHDAAFDYEKMKAYFEPAAEAYQLAAEMGSSDPDVHRAQCELWEKMGLAAFAKGQKGNAEFEAADKACNNAARSSSLDGLARIQRALAAKSRFTVAFDTGIQVEEAERAALAATEDAVRARPRDAMALYVRAATLAIRANRQSARGERPKWGDAIAAFQRALEEDPRFLWALNELGQAYLLQALEERRHGIDPRPICESALSELKRAIEIEPTFSLPLFGIVRANICRIEYETEHGIQADSSLHSLSQAVDLLAAQPTSWMTGYWTARALRAQAAYQRSIGTAFEESLRKADEALGSNKITTEPIEFVAREQAEIRLLEAQYALEDGKTALPKLDRVREKLSAFAADVEAMDTPYLIARLDLLEYRAARKERNAKDAQIQKLLLTVEKLLRQHADEPRLHLLMAEAHCERAFLFLENGQNAGADISEGLAMLDRVLHTNPHHAIAYWTRGELLRARALSSRGETRKSAIAEANEAFRAALRENPRLKTQVEKAKAALDVP